MKHISLNYGAIRDTVFKYSGKQIVAEGGNSTILNSFLKSIKESPVLKIQHIIFENFEKGSFSKERLAERYISQNLKLMENISWEKLIEANRNVRIGLLENCHVESTGDNGELYENIHTLIESVSKKGFTDVDKSNQAYDFILTHLTKENIKKEETIQETEEFPKFLSWNFVTNLAVNNFNQRYAHLNENEKSLLKILLSTDENKINHLEDLKKENLELINSIIESGVDEESQNILSNFKSNIESNLGESIDDTIIHLAELKDTLVDFKK